MSAESLKRKADSLVVAGPEVPSKKSRQSFGQDTVNKARFTSKHKLQYTDRDAKFAKYYSDLASEAKDVRIKAATDLVKHCEDLGNDERDDVTKIHTRLVKGLCSSRKAARLGFFTALTEVLRLTVGDGKVTDISEFLALIHSTTVADSHAAGQEKRDYLIGRMASYGSLINSEILFETALPSADYTEVVKALCVTGQETQWLREECGLNLCMAVRLLARRKRSSDYAKALVEAVCSHNLAKTPEGVAVWLEVKTNFPVLPLPENIWPHQDPLYKKSLSTLANVFKQINTSSEGDSSEVKIIQAGSRQSAPNFAWDLVLASFIKSEGSKNSKQKVFRQFWVEVVDNGFFAPTASAERKSVGFQIFTKVIASAPDWALEVVFSPKLLKCLINQSAKAERYLNKAAKSLLESTAARAKADPATAPVILAGLISENGSIHFDKLTGTKTVQNILQNADDLYLLQLIRRLTSLLPEAGTLEERAAHSTRQSVADQLLLLVRSRYTKSSGDLAPQWLQEILLSFGVHGFTTNTTGKGLANPEITSSTREMLRSRLSSCLTHVLGTQIDQDSTLPAMVVKSIADIESDKNEVWSQADSAVRETITFGLNVVSKLDSKALLAAGEGASTLRALRLLFSMSLIQAYSGETDAIEMLNELQECYESISDESSNKDQAFGTVLEIILSFAAKSSSLHRKLAEQVFTAITAQINSDALQSMLDILAQDESLAGQQALFDQNGAEEEGEEEEDESEENDATSDNDGSDDDDVEEITNGTEAANKADSEEESSEDSSNEESEEDDSDSADAQEIAEFEKLLANALKTTLSTTDAPGSSSDGESMDDDEMMALEPSLQQIFQQRASARTPKLDKKQAKQTVVNFKNRVLDLVAIYAKQQSSSAAAVALVVPLLRLVRTTGSRQIADKTAALLRAYFDAAKSKGLPRDVPAVEAWALLEQVHDEALLFASKVHAAAASRASLFFARLLLALDPGNLDRIVDVYAATQKRCVAGRSKLPSAFWLDWINWSLSMGAA